MDDKPTPPSKAERVKHIAKLMASGQYRTKLTGLDLCELWGISPTTFTDDAAEASRLLVMDEKELDELRIRNLMNSERVIHDAMSRKNTVTGLPDYRAVNEAIRFIQEFIVGDKNKHERDPSDISDDELKALAKKAAAFVAESLSSKSEEKIDEQGQPGDPPKES